MVKLIYLLTRILGLNLFLIRKKENVNVFRLIRKAVHSRAAVISRVADSNRVVSKTGTINKAMPLSVQVKGKQLSAELTAVKVVQFPAEKIKLLMQKKFRKNSVKRISSLVKS